MRKPICGFEMAVFGKCAIPVVEGHLCPIHVDCKCVSCGEPATHEGKDPGKLDYGQLFCDDCDPQ